MNVDVREVAARLFVEYVGNIKETTDLKLRQCQIGFAMDEAIYDAGRFIKKLDAAYPDKNPEFPENFGKSMYAQ